MSIQTSARYYYTECDYRWPIPFPYSDESQVAVTLIEASGSERRLDPGRDYAISNGQVICIVPSGCWLSVWLDGALSTARMAPAAQVAMPAATAAIATLAEAEPAIDPDQACRELETRLEATASAAGQKLALQLDQICASRQNEIMAATAASGDEAATFAAEARRLALEAWQGAERAWHAAATASLHHHRPGISAVRAMEDIWNCPHGLYIVNPHISHAPTPFMGIWPACSENEMNWDGVFFLGKPYPDEPAPPKFHVRPPAGPGLPGHIHASGDSDDWLPCDHHVRRPPCPPDHNCTACAHARHCTHKAC